jgi:cell division protein FtsB
MEIALGANGTMLLAIVVMQLLAAVRWLMVWAFDSTKKREEARDKTLSELSASVSKIAQEIHLMKHTMITDEDIHKAVKVELYNQRGQRQ